MLHIQDMDFYLKIQNLQEKVKEVGIEFIGPTYEMMDSLGDKIKSKKSSHIV